MAKYRKNGGAPVNSNSALYELRRRTTSHSRRAQTPHVQNEAIGEARLVIRSGRQADGFESAAAERETRPARRAAGQTDEADAPPGLRHFRRVLAGILTDRAEIRRQPVHDVKQCRLRSDRSRHAARQPAGIRLRRSVVGPDLPPHYIEQNAGATGIVELFEHREPVGKRTRHYPHRAAFLQLRREIDDAAVHRDRDQRFDDAVRDRMRRLAAHDQARHAECAVDPAPLIPPRIEGNKQVARKQRRLDRGQFARMPDASCGAAA